jgi:hypothetical protein
VPNKWQALFPFTLAVLNTLIVWRFNAFDGSLGLVILAIVVLFGISAIIAASWLPALPYWAIVLLMLGGIVMGIIIDIIAVSRDSPLFPIEIAFLWIVSVVPIALGTWLGRLVRARWYPAKRG